MSEAPMSPEELKGKTRAELLELCRARGMKATGWKRDRMFTELTGETPPPKPASGPDRAAAAEAVAKKQEETEKPDPEAAKKAVKEKQAETQDKVEAPATDKEASLHERMKARTGYCAAISCACASWFPNGMDANRFWPMCDCGHTQWVHAKPEDKRPAPSSTANEESGEEGEGEAEGDHVAGDDAGDEENEPEGDEKGDEEGEEDTGVM